MKGFFGKYLLVNLSRDTMEDYQVSQDWMEKHVGGRGIGARILLDKMDPSADPFGPDNILLFGTGPFQGTGIAGAGRHLVMSKSPKTKSVSGSYAGGFFGHELGKSGYDGIIITGKADTPKYISLLEGEPKIHDADKLWGLDTITTEKQLKEEYSGARVSSIGQAGEKLIKFACIINDSGHAAGRPGFGAVMGSKKLKAVVVNGGVAKDIFDEEGLNQKKTEFARNLMNESGENLGKYGTAGDILGLNELGILPTKNFQEGVFDDAEEISAEKLYEELLTERATCAGCPIRCKRVVKTTFGGETIEGHGPEYETIAGFGSLCLNDDLKSIAAANQKCTLYGLDTISTGNILAFVMEATEKGLLKTGLNWGDGEGIVKMIDKIASREGLGDKLAKGLDYLQEDIGADFAMQIKGQEIPMHDPRGKKGFGLDYATSPRGGTHLEGLQDTYLETESPAPELGVNDFVDRMDFEGKPQLTKTWDELTSFGNSLILCRFVSTVRTGDSYNYDEIRGLFKAVTGIDLTTEEMLKIGERNYALLKILSTYVGGYSRKDDDLPKRLKKALPRGGSAGKKIPDDILQEKINELYELRGFDEYGPTDHTLERLDLDELKGIIKRQT